MEPKKPLEFEECDLGPEQHSLLLLNRLQETISSNLEMQQLVQNLIEDRRFIPPRDRYLRVNSQFPSRVMTNYKPVPELKLSGKWLYTVGFERGQYCRVTCLYGMLIIFPGVEPPPNSY